VIFFGAFGLNMRRNRRISILFFAISALCLYVSLDALP
jgi:predicted nucleic acid-binding Zn ribbon protein